MLVSTPKTPSVTALRVDGAIDIGRHGIRKTDITIPYVEGPVGRIREMFMKVELSVSSYDTAWLAKVPSPDSPRQPCFPESLNWLLKNQLHDGSWSLPSRHDLLIKDSLMSTLACLLALKRWETGEEHVRKGLDFMGSNLGAIIDKKQLSPTGFDIIFPGMIEDAQDLGLNLPWSPNIVDDMLHKRNLEFERLSKCNSRGSKAYMAYVCEGSTRLYDWDEIKKYQRKNGSVLNSPSATAAFFVQRNDPAALAYLRSLVELFGNAVPTMYPIDLYIHLCMVDRLGRLGIGRHFEDEVKEVLDETYRLWSDGDEDIFLDAETCALAFRLLKTNGYEIYPESLAEFNQQEYLVNSAGRNLKDIYSVLELYKASEIRTSHDESVLETLGSWTSRLLRNELSNGEVHYESCLKEVDHVLKFPYDVQQERLETRRNIEAYNVDDIRILKSAYRWCSNVDSNSFLQLAVQDYQFCQSIFQKELLDLEKWAEESRLDKIKVARVIVMNCYLTIAVFLSAPELSDARMFWAKMVVLITVVDFMFDVGDCREELENLIKMVEKWDGNSGDCYCSKEIKIFFLALKREMDELGAIAYAQQGRNVKSHLIELWLHMLKCMMKENDWVRDKSTPPMDEYLKNGSVSIGFGASVLTTLYLMGYELSEEIIKSPEYHNISYHAGVCCRLLNDLQSFKRELEQGKLNSVLLYMIHEGVTEEEAVRGVKSILDGSRIDLLCLVLKNMGSTVPKACKDIFWDTTRMAHLLYGETDAFSSPVGLINALNAIVHEPLNLL